MCSGNFGIIRFQGIGYRALEIGHRVLVISIPVAPELIIPMQSETILVVSCDFLVIITNNPSTSLRARPITNDNNFN